MATDSTARKMALSDKTATSVTITDTNNYFTSDNVEGVLSEVGNELKNIKGYEFYFPEDYGAIGDGITDDSVAFSLMLDDILNNSDTFNRTIKLTQKYYLSEPIEMFDRLRIMCDNTNRKAELIFSNNLTSCFTEPSSTIVAGRLWNFELINLKITSSSHLFVGGTLQFWKTRFDNCFFYSKLVFNGMKFYLSNIIDCTFTCAQVGKELMLVDTWFLKNTLNFSTDYGSSSGIFIELYGSTTTKITSNYFTAGNITSYSGTYTAIKLFNCRTVIFSENIFDTSNGNMFDVGNSSKSIIITNNAIRGWGSMANYTNATDYKRSACIILGDASHICISNNSFSKFIASGVFPSLTNKANYVIEPTKTPTFINISNNSYEDGLIYFEGIQNNCILTEPCYVATVYNIPS